MASIFPSEVDDGMSSRCKRSKKAFGKLWAGGRSTQCLCRHDLTGKHVAGGTGPRPRHTARFRFATGFGFDVSSLDLRLEGLQLLLCLEITITPKCITRIGSWIPQRIQATSSPAKYPPQRFPVPSRPHDCGSES